MHTIGSITSYIDLAQIILYAFWVFFAGLIYYLVRENHREGYPMDNGFNNRAIATGWPIPDPKSYKLENGKTITVPDLSRKEPPLNASPSTSAQDSALEPHTDGISDAVGPGAYTMREDVPELNSHGKPLIQPLRVASAFSVAKQDVDPRGLPVIGGDGKQGGIVRDIWIDSSEMMFRYLEVETSSATGTRRVLLPVPFSRIRRNQIEVNSIYGLHFAGVPGTRSPDQVTKLEEEKISAYYGGGTLYADPARSEPLI